MSKRELISTAVLLLALLFFPGFNHANETNNLVVENKKFVLSPEEVTFIKSLPPLRVMVDDNFGPLSIYDIKTGIYHGISVDLFRHLAGRLGIKYELIYDKSLSWLDKTALFKNRKVDMLMPMSITAERSQTGLFTSSIYVAYYGAIIKKSNNIKIKNKSDMAAYKIGVVKETAIIPFIQSFVPASKITLYDSFTALYQAIKSGEIDIALQNEHVFREDRFNMELFDLTMTHIILESPRKYSYYFYKTDFHKRLAAIIDRYLAAVDYSMLVASYEMGAEEMFLRYNEQKNQEKALIVGITTLIVSLILLGVTYYNQRRFTKKLAATLKQVQNSEGKLRENEEELQTTLNSLRKAFGAIVQVMVSAVEARDPYTAGHQIRTADLARSIATELGLSQSKIDAIRMAGSIHDIGKLSIPAELLSSPKKLSAVEFALIKEHSQSGYEILKDVESPWPLAQIVYQHHERMDGSGYPRHLQGDDILMEARIMAVADVVESMASHRPYRPALGIESGLEEIEKNSGTLYDKDAADACLRIFRIKGYQLI